MNVINKLWMLLRIKYVMSKIVQNIYSIKTNNCSYLDFTDGVRLDQQKDEWYWCSMKVSASKMCNESNHTKISFNQNKYLTSLLPTMLGWIDETMNESDALWRWVHQKYEMSQIIQKLLSIKNNHCYYLDVTDDFVWINKTMNDSNALPIPSSVANSNEGMSHILLFAQYRFFNHFKSTTPYIQMHCTIFQHYHPLDSYIPLFIHGNNIGKK